MFALNTLITRNVLLFASLEPIHIQMKFTAKPVKNECHIKNIESNPRIVVFVVEYLMAFAP